jgi:hypothetical protein
MYIAEVGNDQALGLSMMMLMLLLLIQSLVVPTVIETVGVSNMFYFLAGF